jgi:hypothetical protein
LANSKKKRLEEKLIGLRFNMEDHKVLASKAQDFVVGCNIVTHTIASVTLVWLFHVLKS